LLHDAPLHIRQNWEGQVQFLAHRFGFVGRVNRDRRDARARRANFTVVVAVIRQLAEAEGSPVTAKENKDDGPLQNELRQTAQGARRIGQLEVGCDFSHVWQFGGQHGRHFIGFAQSGKDSGPFPQPLALRSFRER